MKTLLSATAVVVALTFGVGCADTNAIDEKKTAVVVPPATDAGSPPWENPVEVREEAFEHRADMDFHEKLVHKYKDALRGVNFMCWLQLHTYWHANGLSDEEMIVYGELNHLADSAMIGELALSQQPVHAFCGGPSTPAVPTPTVPTLEDPNPVAETPQQPVVPTAPVVTPTPTPTAPVATPPTQGPGPTIAIAIPSRPTTSRTHAGSNTKGLLTVMKGHKGLPLPAKRGVATGSVKATFIAEHNRVRTEHGLDPLEWNDQIAQSALDWGDIMAARHGCELVHGQAASGQGYGQNLYWWGHNNRLADPRYVVYGLADAEKPYYDYATNTCAPNEQCGHYTQIVWKTTKRFGCAYVTCDSGSYKGLAWVCNYDPPGNFVGQKPY